MNFYTKVLSKFAASKEVALRENLEKEAEFLELPLLTRSQVTKGPHFSDNLLSRLPEWGSGALFING
jgi:hypothetical protein